MLPAVGPSSALLWPHAAEGASVIPAAMSNASQPFLVRMIPISSMPQAQGPPG